MERAIAIQEAYGEKYQHCWGCGPKNESGMHLQSFPGEDGESCICRWQPDARYTGGVPQNLFGGMIAMLFDCHGTASAAWFAHHSKGGELTADTLLERFITARLEVDFRKPVPMDCEVQITSYPEELGERKAIIRMEMVAKGEKRAEARMVAVKAKADSKGETEHRK